VLTLIGKFKISNYSLSDTDAHVNILQTMSLATLIGCLTGLIGFAFNYAIHSVVDWVMVLHPVPFTYRMIITPIAGAVLIGLIYKFLIDPENQGFGTRQVRNEIKDISTLVMKPRSVLVKILATLITLVSGLSAGRHGPIVHLGGAIGSNIGYKLNLSREKLRIMISCGVAGAIAGVFNQPIFGTLFVIEVILHKDYLRYLTPVMMSAVSAVFTMRLLGGDFSFVQVNGSFGMSGYHEMIFVLLLGIFAGLVSIVYVKGVLSARAFFEKRFVSPTKSVIVGGLLVSGIGFFVPEIFDLHLHTTESLISNNYLILPLIIIVIAKIAATSITLGSGAYGGGFLPGLFIGAGIGRLFAELILMIPGVTIHSTETYALYGMAALFAGFANAPLSATIMAVELSGNSSLIMPVLLASVISSVIAEVLYKDSIYMHSNF